MIPVTDELLRHMTEQIVEAVNPRQVILFGSHARGDARSDSDLDLLVVEDQPFGPSRSRRAEMVKLWRLLREIPVAKDFLVYSQGEIDELRNDRNHVLYRALREGRVLYDKH